MPRVLILLSEAGPWGAVRAVRRAAGRLPGRFEVTLVEMKTGWRNWWELRRWVVEAKPDVVHAVGPHAATVAFGIARTLRRKPQLITSSFDPSIGFAARLMRNSYHTLPIGPVLYRGAPPRSAPVGAPLQGCGSPRFLLAAGGFDRAANLKAAVWAFDVLKYAEPDLHLVLLGDGPQRSDLEHLARKLGHDDYRVHFAGWQDDVRPYLRHAATVWITHAVGGTTFALEAMAAGIPVVALKTPDTAAVIRDGENGVLVPLGDPVRLAAATRELLADAGRRDRIGCAGRETAAAHTPTTLVNAMSAVYDRLTRTTGRGPGQPE